MKTKTREGEARFDVDWPDGYVVSSKLDEADSVELHRRVVEEVRAAVGEGRPPVFLVPEGASVNVVRCMRCRGGKERLNLKCYWPDYRDLEGALRAKMEEVDEGRLSMKDGLRAMMGKRKQPRREDT